MQEERLRMHTWTLCGILRCCDSPIEFSPSFPFSAQDHGDQETHRSWQDQENANTLFN